MKRAFLETLDRAEPDAGQLRDVLGPDGTMLRPARLETAEWADPDDPLAMQRGADGKRRARRVQGYRVVDPIEHLRARSSDVTDQHVRAANRLRDDFDLSEGGSGGRLPGTISGPSSNCPNDTQLDALKRYREAVQALGTRQCAVLLPVVLSGWSVAQVAKSIGGNASRVQGYLMAGLDRLCDHYWPEKDPATIRPPHAVVYDAGVEDVPQERLGRWRVSA